MAPIDCPDCLEDAGVEIDRTLLDDGLKRTFECDECGYVWNVVF